MTPDYARLAEAIRARCKTLRLLQEDLIRESSLGRTTVQRLWRGDEGGTPSRRTLQALDAALRWKQGSARRVLDGEDPAPLEDGDDIEIDRETGFAIHERDAVGRVSSFAILSDLTRQLPEENIEQLLAIARTMFEHNQWLNQDSDN